MILKKVILVLMILFVLLPTAQAVEYPIMFLSGNVGYGQNDLASGLAIKGAFRYSLEGYFPGLQLEASYATVLTPPIEEETEKLNKEEENIFKTELQQHQVALTGLLQLRPFGKGMILFVGGGGNFNFLKCDSTWTEKYWDPEIDDFQELPHDPENLFQKTVPGYHAVAGLRWLLGGIGSLDIEARQTFLNIPEGEWKFDWAEKKYGEKKWDNFSINVGLTIHIF